MPVPEGTAKEALSDAGRDSIADYVLGVVEGTLSDSVYAVTDLPALIAGNDPVGVPTGVLRGVTRAACRTYARGGGPQNLPGFDAAWGGICEPYLDSIGESPIPGDPAGPPFRGGQCYTGYQFTFTATDLQGNRASSAQGTGGRLIGTEVRPSGNGNQVAGYTRQLSPGAPIDFIGLQIGNPGVDLNPVISGVTPNGGGADTCGDPPPLYDPPKVKPGLPPFTPDPIDIPGIGPQPIDITFDPDGTINIGLPDVGVDVAIEDPFGLQGDGGAGGAPGAGTPPPGDVGAAGEGVNIGAGGEAEGEAPPGSVLTGVRVQITAFPNSRAKYTEDVFRGAYYVYMGVPALLDLDFGGAMVRQDQFFFAEKDNLTKWRVSANTGYELITTPYYREVEAA